MRSDFFFDTYFLNNSLAQITFNNCDNNSKLAIMNRKTDQLHGYCDIPHNND